MKGKLINLHSFSGTADYLLTTTSKSLSDKLLNTRVLKVSRSTNNDALSLMGHMDAIKHDVEIPGSLILMSNYTKYAKILMGAYGQEYFDYPIPDLDIFMVDTKENSYVSAIIGQTAKFYKQLGATCNLVRINALNKHGIAVAENAQIKQIETAIMRTLSPVQLPTKRS